MSLKKSVSRVYTNTYRNYSHNMIQHYNMKSFLAVSSILKLNTHSNGLYKNSYNHFCSSNQPNSALKPNTIRNNMDNDTHTNTNTDIKTASSSPSDSNINTMNSTNISTESNDKPKKVSRWTKIKQLGRTGIYLWAGSWTLTIGAVYCCLAYRYITPNDITSVLYSIHLDRLVNLERINEGLDTKWGELLVAIVVADVTDPLRIPIILGITPWINKYINSPKTPKAE
mmetsp:Transcript_959/g.1290  ORF Transcript_959/g.1290 Transcript_959/m.1290 type:complete len:227 (-) Transcript_959:443-1123(-)